MSGTQGVNAGNAAAITGISTGDIQSMSLEDLMFFVMSQRSDNLDDAVRGYADQIQKRNDLMKLTNKFLAEARNAAAPLAEDGSAAMSPEMTEFLKTQGISLPNETAATTSMTAEEKLKVAKEVKTWLANSKPDTDDGCKDGDVTADIVNKAKSVGIAVADDGDGPGQNWETKDFEKFSADVNIKVDELEKQVAKGAGAAGGGGAAGGSFTKKEWEAVINNIQGFQEGLNNDSQLDMIKFQSLMSKYTTSVEMLSNVMKKLSDNASAIVRNMT